MDCHHFWRTTEELSYGYVSTCEKCGRRESAEHSPECPALYREYPETVCTCGADEEFAEYESRRAA